MQSFHIESLTQLEKLVAIILAKDKNKSAQWGNVTDSLLTDMIAWLEKSKLLILQNCTVHSHVMSQFYFRLVVTGLQD